MRPTTLIAVSSLAVAFLAGGCFETADRFRDAIPSADNLAMNVPESGGSAASGGGIGSSSAALVGDRAVLYEVTHDVSYVINGGVYVVLSIIGDIASYPPTTLDETSATWGPFTPTLSPVTYKLVSTIVGENTYEYALLARNRSATAEEDFVAIMAGTSYLQAHAELSGSFFIDLDALQSADPGGDHGTGRLVAAYDTMAEPRFVEVAFEAFRVENQLGDPIDGVYRYTENVDQSGTFVFGVEANLDESPAIETMVVTSRWDAGGAGRGDAIAVGGDIPAGVTAYASECWDDGFGRTFYTDNVGLMEDQGDAEACPFADPLFEE